MNQTIKMLAALVATAALVASLAACTAAGEVAAPRVCDQAPEVTPNTPTVAILGEVGDTLLAHQDDIDLIVDGSQETESRLIVSGVGDSNAPSVVVDSLMVGEGVNPMERKLDLQCKRELVISAVAELTGGTHDKLDVFRALIALDGNLTERSGAPIDIALLTSLASSAAPVDLTDPAVLADPIGALNTLAASSLIPDCTGWRFHGISTGSADDPALREFWRQYALRCGGAVVAWTTHLTVFPGDAGPVAEADTEQIVVTEDEELVTADLAGDVLFAPGSPDLRLEAEAALQQLLALTEQAHGPILVVGHTDVGGIEAENVTLSENRAASVAVWLIAQGVDSARISTEGCGSRDAIYPDPQTDEERQANRRVVVTIARS